ncbi:MAG: hypothetical protein HKN75_01660 [Bacteroidia bacterium]|nr:hypothetical protein [Bacteroidia bacterium]
MEQPISMKQGEGKFIHSSKLLLYISIGSMTMLFAGLTSGYIVRQAQENWLVFDLPSAFHVSTVLILISSLTMHWALTSIKKNNLEKTRLALMITLGLGLGFCFTQFLGWSQMVSQNIYFNGNPSGSFLYAITVVHLGHMVAAIIAIINVNLKCLKGKYSQNNYLGISLVSIFWHFLDIMWIYLFVFLLFVR